MTIELKPRLVVVSNPIDEPRFDRIDRDASLIVLAGRALENVDETTVRRIVSRSAMLVCVGEGTLQNAGLAAALFSDFLALRADAEIDLSSGPSFPIVAAALLNRLGRRGGTLLLRRAGLLTASEAQENGIADLLVPRDVDSLEWARSWIGGRSILALQSGALLLRQRHPVAERAEFARLFATGEPRHGMRMFLTRMPLDFKDRYQVEKI